MGHPPFRRSVDLARGRNDGLRVGKHADESFRLVVILGANGDLAASSDRQGCADTGQALGGRCEQG
jgi:hypothetical protein